MGPAYIALRQPGVAGGFVCHAGARPCPVTASAQGVQEAGGFVVVQSQVAAAAAKAAEAATAGASGAAVPATPVPVAAK